MTRRRLVRVAGAVAVSVIACSFVLGQSQGLTEITGSIVSLDEAFGSVGTSITAQDLQEAGITVGDVVRLSLSDRVIEVPVVSDLFPYLPPSLPGLIVWGNVYIVGWYTNIAAEYGVAIGDGISIHLAQKGGYLDEIAEREVERIERRDECSTDEEYANFREVSCGNIADGVLFRSSHPADGSVKSAYAHALMVQAGVQTIINVGASWNDPQQAFDNSDCYRARGEEGAVLATNIGLAVTWPHFKTELGRVLRFMIDHEPPYLIHCSLGQDRAGITSAVLAALAEADLQDVIDDYALTFANYYRITSGHTLYPEVVEQLVSEFREMNNGSEVGSENLQSVVEAYLTGAVGLCESEIRLLQERLSGSPYEVDTTEASAASDEPATVPTSAEPTVVGKASVLFDEAHDEFNTISETRANAINSAHPEWHYFGEMAESLSSEGYTLERGLSHLTPTFLASFDVVILATPQEAFFDDELVSLLTFVEDGGGLLVVQDAGPCVDIGSNQIAGLLGARFREGVLRSHHGDWDPESFRVDPAESGHSIVRGVDAFQMNWGCSIEATPDWIPLLRTSADTWQDTDGNGLQDAAEPTGPLVAAVAAQVGRGRVILVGDNAFQSGVWHSNETFFVNSLSWLAEGAAEDTPRVPRAEAQDSRIASASSILEQPNWDSVSWKESYARGVTPAKYWKGGGQLPVSQGVHWELPGSDVKGVKIASTNAGVFIRAEIYLDQMGEFYTYQLHLRPPGRPEAILFVDLNPASLLAELSQSVDGEWYNLGTKILVVEASESGITCFTPHFVLPSGDSAREVENWDLVTQATYNYGTEMAEYYEFPHTNVLGQSSSGGFVLPVDGFGSGFFGCPVGEWHITRRQGDNYVSRVAAPVESEDATLVRISYAEEGDLQIGRAFEQFVDVSDCDGFQFTARSDQEIDLLLKAVSHDPALARRLDPEDQKETRGVCHLEGGATWTTYRVPFCAFSTAEWVLQVVPDISLNLDPTSLGGIFFEPLGQKGLLEISQLAFYSESTDLSGLSLCPDSVSWSAEDALPVGVSSPSTDEPWTEAPSELWSVDGLEYIGNPLRERYPDQEGLAYARTLWDLQAWDGRIYLGYGNSNNVGPAPNAGPIDIWSYEPDPGLFRNEFTVDEEQIDVFVAGADKLYIPGHDATESWDYGNIYVLQRDEWVKYRTLPNAVHVYDLAERGTRIVVAGSFVILGGSPDAGGGLAFSDDGGKSWVVDLHLGPFTGEDDVYRDCAPDDPGVWRFTKLFTFAGDLYASGWGMSRIYRMEDDAFVFVDVNPFPGVESRYDASPTRLEEADATPEDELLSDPFVGGYITQAVEFHGRLIYIGGALAIDHDWNPFGLYVAAAMQNDAIGALDFLADGENPRDIIVNGGDRVLLLTTSEADTGYQNRVYVTDDLHEWHEALVATCGAPAYSFEILSDYLYLGLGGDAPASGNLYRIELSDLAIDSDTEPSQ